MNTSWVSDHTLSMKLHELNHTISVIPVLTQAHPLCNSDTCWYIIILKLARGGGANTTHTLTCTHICTVHKHTRVLYTCKQSWYTCSNMVWTIA